MILNITVDKLKEHGTYVGFVEEYGYVYEIEGVHYGLKAGKVVRIREALVL
jgi:hypothetical protein